MPRSALLQRIQRVAEKARFSHVAVSFHDYETALRFSYCGDRVFHAASTIKVALLVAVYRCAEEGRIRLGDTLHVRNRFRSAVGEEVFRVNLDRDADPEVHKRLGRSMRVRELARAMIVRSSNLATNLLLDYLGLDEVNRVLDAARIDGVLMRRGVEDNRAFEHGVNNEITADGLVKLFRLLCQDSFFRGETREQILEVLRAQEFNTMIPAGLPDRAKATVAHKTGEISTICHDAGIVSLPGRKPYVVAILTEMAAEVETRHAPVAEISRTVFEYLTAEGDAEADAAAAANANARGAEGKEKAEANGGKGEGKGGR